MEPLDTSFHDRRLARRLEDPEFRAEYEQARSLLEIIKANATVPGGVYSPEGINKTFEDLARREGKR